MKALLGKLGDANIENHLAHGIVKEQSHLPEGSYCHG